MSPWILGRSWDLILVLATHFWPTHSPPLWQGRSFWLMRVSCGYMSRMVMVVTELWVLRETLGKCGGLMFKMSLVVLLLIRSLPPY